MPVEKERVLPLYHFFERLRQNEFPLGIDEYQRFLTAFTQRTGLTIDDYSILLDTVTAYDDSGKAFDILPKEQLLRLCKLLWLKPNQSLQVFEELFEETFAMDFPVAQKKAEETTTTPLPKPPFKDDTDNKKIPENPDVTPDEQTKQTTPVIETEIQEKAVLVRVALQTETSGGVIELKQDEEAGTEKSKFLFTSNYYPIDRRKTQQNLKHITSFGYTQKSPEIDVEATIEKAIDEGGYLIEPVYKKLKVNTTSLLLLIDHQGSMVAFDQLTSNIITEAEEALMPNKKVASKTLKTFYFYNIPGESLYTNKTHTRHEPLVKVMSTMKNRSAGVVIISDAGTARSRYNPYRVKETSKLLTQLYGYTKKIAWLNPLPKDRWTNTSAEEIAKQVSMFEATENGIKSAIDLLRGSTSKIINVV